MVLSRKRMYISLFGATSKSIAVLVAHNLVWMPWLLMATVRKVMSCFDDVVS
jgi:hypothetical protein